MKLLIVTPNYPPEGGGPASSSWELLHRLPPKIAVQVISFTPEKISVEPEVRLVSTDGSSLERQLRFFLWCLRWGFNTDIFLLMEPGVVGPAGFLAAKLLGKKVITKYFGDPVWEESQRLRKTQLSLTDFLAKKQNFLNWQSFLSRIVVTYSDGIIVPFEFLADVLEQYYGLNKEKIAILYSPAEIPSGVGKKTGWEDYIGRFKDLLKKL